MLPKLPKLHKQPRLKPLDLSDVMVALINQQHTIDHTQEYKLLLGIRYRNPSYYQQEEQQQILQLPEFATKELNQAQIMDYHIRDRTKNTEEYELLLAKVDQRIKVAMYQYSDKLKQGQTVIQQLMQYLGDAYTKISSQRKYISLCVQRVKNSYSNIGPTLRKINNISKVIQIMSIWGQSKLPYLFSIDINHPYRYNIQQTLQLFKSASQKICNNALLKQSQSLQKILSSLKQKNIKLITNICSQFTDSIIHFDNVHQYKIKYQQYIYISQIGLCNNVLTQQNIKNIIQLNAKSMFYGVLIKLTPNMNVDLLNQSIYLDFYDEIIQEYVIYFKSWHYVTTFHLDNGTPYGQLFLQSRKLVFMILSSKIAKSIQNSQKFISLEYRIKLQLVQKLQDYIQAGQKWMGTYEGMQLSRIVTVKLSKELQNIFMLYNNLVKNILTQELSVTALQTVDNHMSNMGNNNNNNSNNNNNINMSNMSNSRTKQKIKAMQQQINYQKISKFLSFSSQQNTLKNLPQYSYNIQKMSQSLPQAPAVQLKIGTTLIQMISQYLQRSKYLQSNKSIYINKILQHFQFILFMLYQLCIRQHIKQQLTTPTYIQKITQLQSIKLQQISIKQLNQLIKILMLRRNYAQIVQFLKTIHTKYDGIKIVGVIDVNRVFQSNNNQIINGYTKLVVRVIGDLIKIIKWLILCIPYTLLKAYRECNRFNKLLDILKLIFGLMLENNMQNIHKKYIENVGSIMIKLKWEIKKFNQQTANLYKQYKMKILQIFRNNTLLFIIKSQTQSQPQIKQLIQIVSNKQIQTLYKSLLQLYGKIQKINDNGRQLIRMDSIQICKILHQIGINCQNWSVWFDKYLDFTSQRSYKIVLDKIIKIGILYQPLSWRYQLLWIISDLSFKEKKQYNIGLAKIYMTYLTEAR